MSGGTFEISKEGVKLSYERFLSDSAGGYALALVVLSGFLFDIPIPSSGLSWRDLVPGAAPAEAVVLGGLLIIFLGTPLGLLMNSISWFTLGSVQVLLANFWHKHYKLMSLFTYSTTQAYNISVINHCFNLNKPKKEQDQSFYLKSSLFEELLQEFFPATWSTISHVQGIKTFSRNLSLIAIGMAYYAYLLGVTKTCWFFILMFVFLLLLSSLMEFYIGSATLYKVYLLCCYRLKNNDWPQYSTEDIVNELLRLARKSSSEASTKE